MHYNSSHPVKQAYKSVDDIQKEFRSSSQASSQASSKATSAQMAANIAAAAGLREGLSVNDKQQGRPKGLEYGSKGATSMNEVAAYEQRQPKQSSVEESSTSKALHTENVMAPEPQQSELSRQTNGPQTENARKGPQLQATQDENDISTLEAQKESSGQKIDQHSQAEPKVAVIESDPENSTAIDSTLKAESQVNHSGTGDKAGE